MQKNNCKLKTIFKKGLSFSIALALGAAATSLNLAKTAYAVAPVVTSARTVYLAGEKVEQISGATKLKVNDSEVTENPMSHIMATSDTKLNFGDNEDTTNWSKDVAVKVYDWDEIKPDKSVTAAHKADHDTARDAIVAELDLKMATSDVNGATILNILKTGELQTTDGTKIDDVDYSKHNGKDVQIKVNGVTCKLGKLEVTRAVTKVELVSAPTRDGYLSGDKINLAGLSLNVTYEAGDAAEVAWTEATKGDFTFGSTGVAQNATITGSINDIAVTYGGKTTEDKFTLYVVSTKDKAAGKIAEVSGTFDQLNAVNAIALSENSESYATLKSDFAEDAEVIFAYDVRGDHNVSLGKIRVTLNVGKNYATKEVTVKHLANDGGIETFIDKVDEDGNVTVEVKSLSPFMVALGVTEADKEAAEETEKKNEEADKNEVTNAENTATVAPTNTDSVKKADSKSASKSVKTGDASVIAFSVFGFVALVSAAVLAFMKKNRKNLEK